MRVIGDVHGKIGEYLHIIDSCDESIQVGDFGVGFVDIPEIDDDHMFIRGNHDNPYICKEMKNCIPDGTMHKNFFCVGGAFSIDKAYRTPGLDWWQAEELSYEEMNNVINEYERVKPEYVISHDCPKIIGEQIFGKNSSTKIFSNRTNMGLESMFEIHKPKLWIFGHWHDNQVKNILGCEFICLDELNYIDVSV